MNLVYGVTALLLFVIALNPHKIENGISSMISFNNQTNTTIPAPVIGHIEVPLREYPASIPRPDDEIVNNLNPMTNNNCSLCSFCRNLDFVSTSMKSFFQDNMWFFVWLFVLLTMICVVHKCMQKRQVIACRPIVCPLPLAQQPVSAATTTVATCTHPSITTNLNPSRPIVPSSKPASISSSTAPNLQRRPVTRSVWAQKMKQTVLTPFAKKKIQTNTTTTTTTKQDRDEDYDKDQEYSPSSTSADDSETDDE